MFGVKMTFSQLTSLAGEIMHTVTVEDLFRSRTLSICLDRDFVSSTFEGKFSSLKARGSVFSV